MEYARAGDRLLAAIIDVVVILVSIGVVAVAVVVVSFLGDAVAITATVLGVVAYVGIPVYIYVVMTAKTGQTVGKRLLGIKVVDAQGNVPSIGTVLMREILGKLVSSSFLYVGYLWIIFDSRVQGWHDKIANTFVVKA